MTHKIQIDDVVRDATPDEVAVIEQIQADAQAYEASLRQAAADKQAAKAKLKALGLTDAEITALVG